MVPYQLSEPTTFQPAVLALAATPPASPLVRGLLKTSTKTSARLIRLALGLAALVVAGALAVGVLEGLLTAGVASSLVGAWSGSLATNTRAATAIAEMHRASSRVGSPTPRSSRIREGIRGTPRGRIRAGARSADAGGGGAGGGGGPPHAGGGR